MPVIEITTGQIIITVTGSEIKVDRVTSGLIAGVQTQNLIDSPGDQAAALAVIQNAIFQAR